MDALIKIHNQRQSTVSSTLEAPTQPQEQGHSSPNIELCASGIKYPVNQQIVDMQHSAQQVLDDRNDGEEQKGESPDSSSESEIDDLAASEVIKPDGTFTHLNVSIQQQLLNTKYSHVADKLAMVHLLTNPKMVQHPFHRLIREKISFSEEKL